MQSKEATSFQSHEALSRYEQDLVKEGLITSDQLAIARISKENLGLDIGSVLIKKGFVTEETLLKFLAGRMGVPYLSLKNIELVPDLIHSIPFHIAKQHGILPLYRKDNKIAVAMANPFDAFAKDDIKDWLKSEIEPYLANAREIEEVLSQFYKGKIRDDEQILTVEVSTEDNQAGEVQTKKMQEMAQGPKIVSLVNNLFATANSERASDIHIEPTRHFVQIRYRVDGLLREKGQLEKSQHLPVVSRIKILAGLDIAERRVPQDGRVRILLVGKPLDLRISTCPTQHGEKIVIRLLSKDQVKSIEGLGFNETQRHIFSDIISKPNGIFLSTGPTGSGKSTTLYAALTRINSPEKNIISIEDPIENEIAGVNQVAVNTKTGLTFAAVLRSVLRQDPDVIMLGEIRDSETAQIAVRAAITGHMVLSTLHTNTAVGAISRLQDLGVEAFLIASALKGIMAQRLVRKICTLCRQEVKESLAAFANMAFKPKKMFRGKGCEACHFTGYAGRMAIFELAPVDEKICQLIHNRAAEAEILKTLRETGTTSIAEDGLKKVDEGITTVDEVLKVTQEE